MNKLVTTLLFLLILQPVISSAQVIQTEAKPETKSGFFFDLVLKGEIYDTKWALTTGFNAGWVFNHSIRVGGGLYGMPFQTIDARFIDSIAGNKPSVNFNYGGAFAELTCLSNNLFDLTASAFAGIGKLNFIQKSKIYINNNPYLPDYGGAWYTILQPSVCLVSNNSRWFRFMAGAGYKLCFGSAFEKNGITYTANDLQGFWGLITIRLDMLYF